jgi:hypothetical protein
MQRSEAGVGLVDPEESGANAALMHHAVKIILQSEKIEAVVAKVVEVIVVHPRALKLETHRAENPAGPAVDDDPLIFHVPLQAIFGGQVIGVFVENLKEIFVELVDVGSDCVFQRGIWPQWGQSIVYHATVSSDWIEYGLLKRSGNAVVGRLCQVTSDYVAWQVHVTQDLLEVG